MAVVKGVTAVDIYKNKLSGSDRLIDNLSPLVGEEKIKSTGDTPTESTAKPNVKTKAEYQADIFSKLMAKQEQELVNAPKKKAKKKIKLSKTEKKDKAKKERKEAFEKAIPKHQARKNKSKGKPKRLKLAEKESAESNDKAASDDNSPWKKTLKSPPKKATKKAIKRIEKDKDITE